MPSLLHPDTVAVPGFTDHHTHLLRDSAGVVLPVAADVVRAQHQQVAAAASTPMDIPDPEPTGTLPELAGRLRAGLARAAAAGLTEVTEMGLPHWRLLDGLIAAQEAGPLPARVRVYLASGLAAAATPAALAAARRRTEGPWVRVEGVKFYADGWLGPRTCAVSCAFADRGDADRGDADRGDADRGDADRGDGNRGGADHGVLFLDSAALARRIAPLAEAGWRIATHAIGDRAVAAVLDGYDLVWGRDRAALAAARPRIEHASLLSAELIARMADYGVTACIQPSFAVTDAAQIPAALGPERRDLAYPWARLIDAGAPVVAGSDYPVEVLDPLPGLARLVRGRSARPGFESAGEARPGSRLPLATALALMTDAGAGTTELSADPSAVAPDQLDQITVAGTNPAPFRP